MLRPKGRLNWWEGKFEAIIWAGGQGLQIEKAHFKSQGKYENIVAKGRMKTSSGIKLPIYAGEWVDEVRRLGGLSAIPQPLPCRFTPKQCPEWSPRVCAFHFLLPILICNNAGRKPDQTVQRANWMGWGLVSRLGLCVEGFCFSK